MYERLRRDDRGLRFAQPRRAFPHPGGAQATPDRFGLDILRPAFGHRRLHRIGIVGNAEEGEQPVPQMGEVAVQIDPFPSRRLIEAGEGIAEFGRLSVHQQVAGARHGQLRLPHVQRNARTLAGPQLADTRGGQPHGAEHRRGERRDRPGGCEHLGPLLDGEAFDRRIVPADGAKKVAERPFRRAEVHGFPSPSNGATATSPCIRRRAVR
ncbi:hypothetical protein GCM10023069_18300 [Shinella granuli]